MEIGKTFCGRTDGRTDGRTHLSSNLLGHRRGDDLKMLNEYAQKTYKIMLALKQHSCKFSRPTQYTLSENLGKTQTGSSPTEAPNAGVVGYICRCGS